MNDDTVNDLKQFIATTVSQQVTEVIERLDGVDERLNKVEARLGNVEHKIDDLSHSVAEALDNSNESTATQLADHEQRIGQLEQKAA